MKRSKPRDGVRFWKIVFCSGFCHVFVDAANSACTVTIAYTMECRYRPVELMWLKASTESQHPENFRQLNLHPSWNNVSLLDYA